MPAGDVLLASDTAPRLDTQIVTALSATYTGTETSPLMTTSAYLTAGLRYAVRAWVAFSTSSAASPSVEITFIRIREDNNTGNQIQGVNLYLPTTGSTGFPMQLYGEYTAAVDGVKSFVLTGVRVSGAGSHRLTSSAASPGYMTIDEILT